MKKQDQLTQDVQMYIMKMYYLSFFLLEEPCAQALSGKKRANQHAFEERAN
jgi:hypothetical protein